MLTRQSPSSPAATATQPLPPTATARPLHATSRKPTRLGSIALLTSTTCTPGNVVTTTAWWPITSMSRITPRSRRSPMTSISSGGKALATCSMAPAPK